MAASLTGFPSLRQTFNIYHSDSGFKAGLWLSDTRGEPQGSVLGPTLFAPWTRR